MPRGIDRLRDLSLKPQEPDQGPSDTDMHDAWLDLGDIDIGYAEVVNARAGHMQDVWNALRVYAEAKNAERANVVGVHASHFMGVLRQKIGAVLERKCDCHISLGQTLHVSPMQPVRTRPLQALKVLRGTCELAREKNYPRGGETPYWIHQRPSTVTAHEDRFWNGTTNNQ